MQSRRGVFLDDKGEMALVTRCDFSLRLSRAGKIAFRFILFEAHSVSRSLL